MKTIFKTVISALVINLFLSFPSLAQYPYANFSGLWIENKPANDQTPALTSSAINGRGTNNANYVWTWQTAAIGGGYGVTPNGLELWEYPDAGGNYCCRPRLIIKPSRILNGNPKPLLIDEYGNVGIGTSNTGPYQLAVEGKIGAREIKVTLANPWADYVFNKSYKLRSLYSVEKFIQANKHLPGIPSAPQVEEAGGVELGDINRKLLEKVEELTLYVIQIKKENDEIKIQMKKLQGKK